jgi:hypothetical protein
VWISSAISLFPLCLKSPSANLGAWHSILKLLFDEKIITEEKNFGDRDELHRVSRRGSPCIALRAASLSESHARYYGGILWSYQGH